MLARHLNPCEDSLTAAVFSHLLHLPAELFWQIVRGACYFTEHLPSSVGEPEIHFWPKWNPEGTSNSSYVEPDLFLRFQTFDLIIEAKRWDARMQSQVQWQAELRAYANEYGEDRKPVRMIALGGLHVERSDTLSTRRVAEDGRTHDFICPVIMCRWQGILNQCRRRQRELNQLALQTSISAAEARVLADVIDLFSCHGFSTGRWFEDFGLDRTRLAPTLQPHLARLRAWRT
jgi:hypothetical protein